MRLWFPVALACCALSCKDELVEDVPPEVCVSGHRWIGGKRGSEEMYPGRDCVGCHLENDGPQLMAGGTVYAIPQGGPVAGPLVLAATGKPQAHDCFGLQDVKITITGADLEPIVRYTNRAGNFFVEGRPSELAKPIFTVELSYPDPLTGIPIEKTMYTTPSYGGCARCHTPDLKGPDIACTPADDPECVVPFAFDYIDVGLPITDFVNSPTAASEAR